MTGAARSSWLTGALVAGAILAAWAAAVEITGVSRALMPSPRRVFDAFVEVVESGELKRHVAVSTLRLIVGFLLSALLGLTMAFVFARSALVRRILEPPLEFLRQIPPLAMMPLLILWLGIGEAQKIGIITLACFFPIFLSTAGGIGQCDRRIIEVGQVYGLTDTEILRRIVLPAALPSVVVGLRIALGQGWRALVGAELIASAAGLGYMIEDSQNLARTDIVMVGVLVIGCLGLISDRLFRMAVGRIWPWVPLGSGEAGNA